MADRAERLVPALRRSGAGWYPLVALGALVVVFQFQGYAFLVLGPEINRELGAPREALAGIVALGSLPVTVAGIWMAGYVQKRGRRGLVASSTGVAWSIATIATAFTANTAGLAAASIVFGAAGASVPVIHQPLIVDAYPPAVRVRVLSVYAGAFNAGNVLAPLLVGVLSGLLAFTWRGVFLVMGILSLLGAAVSFRLKDPSIGTSDPMHVREAPDLTSFEIFRRLLFIPTIRRILASSVLVGMMIVPLYTFLFFFLDERWGMGPGARAALYAYLAFAGVVALSLFGARGERAFRSDPAKLVRMISVMLAIGVVLLAAGSMSPRLAGLWIAFGLSVAFFSVLSPGLNAAMLSVVPAHMRSHVSALQGIFLGLVGGLLGLVLLSGVALRFGPASAVVSLAIPGLAAAYVLSSSAKTIKTDIDAIIAESAEAENVQTLRSQGTHFALLECRDIAFAYDGAQVLFDVGISVEEGELVALLGPNGAGKSTLLGVISGLLLPQGGRVRLHGTDITYVDAERRVRAGIVSVSGDRSVFPSLTVEQNLRLFAYSREPDPGRVERAFEAFPSLRGRTRHRASTLSGGERHMLALARALVLEPKLLLVDELAHGLSPALTRELLRFVRGLTTTGTSVVLVEQSARMALSLADRAYFMDRGRVRFEGPARELEARGDLLRSFFLQGSADRLGG